MTDEIVPEATKKRRSRKPFVGLEVKVGPRKYRGDTYQITTQFLIVTKGASSTYIALAGCPTFEVRDTRIGPRAAPPMVSTTTGPRVAGGPPGLGLMRDPSADNRNRELESLMGPVLGS